MKKLHGVLAVSLLLAGCAGHSNTPDGVAKGFLQALVDNQTAEAFKLSNTTMSQNQIHDFRGFSPKVRANANGVAVQRTKQSDSEHAVVDVRLNLKDGNYYDFIYHVVRIDGTWKVVWPG